MSGGPSAVSLGQSNEGTLIDLDEVADILECKRPNIEPNQAAADLLHFAVALKLSRSWTVPKTAEALVRVCEQLAVLSERPNPLPAFAVQADWQDNCFDRLWGISCERRDRR